MQRIFNLLGLAGFLLSGSMTAALVISFMQMDSIQKKAVQRITGEITSAVEKELTGKLDGKFDGMMQSLPTTTGPAVPFLKK
jgi:hypothetical protein